eukprot:c17608_g1_i1.p1 GENE.c17608_g1_i1~~c17608_g1_i1.p1  ORF type:complete len:308 (+),score=118.86 c17608_g1_i1:45-926(+)
MTLNIAILGTSGHIGQATVKYLSEHHNGHNITAFVRDPSSDKSSGVKLPNITVKAGDMGDEAGSASNLQGFDVAFIISPGHHDRTPITQAAIRASKTAGVKHIVVVSVLTAEKTDQTFGRQFTPVEQTAKQTGIAYTLLRLPLFMDNNFAHVQTIKSHATFYGPQDPQATYGAISVSDVGEAAGKILTQPENHVNKTYNLISAPFTIDDVATAFSETLGKEVKYVRVDYAAAKQAFIGMGFPEWQTEGVLELLQNIDNKEPIMSLHSDDFKHVTGRDPATINHWVHTVASAFQ